MSKPSLTEFFEHATRNAEQPPFVRLRFLSSRPREQQKESFLPAVDRLPEAMQSDQ